MQVPHHIRWHIMPFSIAAVIVCGIGVIAHAYWTRQSGESTPASAVVELRDDTVVTGSR